VPPNSEAAEEAAVVAAAAEEAAAAVEETPEVVEAAVVGVTPEVVEAAVAVAKCCAVLLYHHIVTRPSICGKIINKFIINELNNDIFKFSL
jgi:hypothetical protein